MKKSLFIASCLLLICTFKIIAELEAIKSSEYATDKNIAIQTKLHEAIKNQNISLVREALNNGASPFLINPYTNQTSLFDSLVYIDKYSTNIFGSKTYKGLSVLSGIITIYTMISTFYSVIELYDCSTSKICDCEYLRLQTCDKKSFSADINCARGVGFIHALSTSIPAIILELYATKKLWESGNNASKALEIFKVLVEQPGFALDEKSKEFIEKKFRSLRGFLKNK